ncbi:MAG: ABC transporter ATP-binding protein [Erysipelotrichaceae bacterium]|nr:ABC transporter ATP-binding protein [Erysipelotrichaceae bacterium]
MGNIVLDDVTMIYPFQKVDGLFDRKQKKLILEKQKAMPYTSNEGVIALQHFSAEIKEGEFVVILGPSGSGKTTLLRIIAGLERPVLGTVSFDGVDGEELKAEDRDIAMVFQNYALYPNQSVYQNLAFPLEVKHTPREEIEKEVYEVSELLDIADKLKKLPDELSGGEKQRVAIARALIKKPSIMLFDEPFANLDVPMHARLRSELQKIHNKYKTTFIYVTHDQYDALALAERLIILKDGIKQMDDSVANVYNYPINRFCGQFLGSPAMNIFEDVEVKDGKIKLFDAYYALDHKQLQKLGKERKVDVGIRSVNIEINKVGYPADVEYVENIEADDIIHLDIDGHKITVTKKADNGSSQYLRGQKVKLHFDRAYFHIFNKEGERL